MGHFAGVKCDNCGETWTSKYRAKKYINILVRGEGWSIANGGIDGEEAKTLCPDCRVRKKR